MNLDCEKEQIREWILRFRNGDQEAFRLLYSQYRPLIEASVAKYSVGADFSATEDMRQEATVAFCNSISNYDVDQSEVEFGLYAKICISNTLISHLRKMKRSDAEPLCEAHSRNLFVHENTEDLSESILEQERVKMLYSVIKESLSPFEYRIWHAYMSGRTAKEIAGLYGRDERSVSNAIYRIRRKLRTKLQ